MEKRRYVDMEDPAIIALNLDQPPLTKRKIEIIYKRKYTDMEDPINLLLCLEQPPTKRLAV
jgi:hypothetical protein